MLFTYIRNDIYSEKIAEIVIELSSLEITLRATIIGSQFIITHIIKVHQPRASFSLRLHLEGIQNRRPQGRRSAKRNHP
jgi:hypothetical protein